MLSKDEPAFIFNSQRLENYFEEIEDKDETCGHDFLITFVQPLRFEDDRRSATAIPIK